MLSYFAAKKMDESQWFQAAENGDLALIKKGINVKTDVNCRDSEGRTAVWWAAQEGHLQLVEYLVTQHADLSIDDLQGHSPLQAAAANDCEAVAAVLLDNGADVNQADNSGLSPLHHAALYGHEAVAVVLIKNRADVNLTTNLGSTPLHYAANNDYEAVVALLLSNGANANHINNKGRMPIDVANMQTIKDTLVAHTKQQQEVEEKEEQQEPPGQAPSNSPAVPKMMDESQWFQAAKIGDLALIQQGINDKIDVNCKDGEDRTAVWWSAQEGHLQLVEFLVTQHADLSIVDKKNRSSPLHWAAFYGHDAVVAALLSNGANINQANNHGSSPLHWAAIEGHDAAVAVLLSNGANVNQVTDDGKSPLHLAANRGEEAVVAVLLSNGADVNQADNNGEKPIDVAKTQKIKDMLIAHTKKKQHEVEEKNEQQPGQAPSDGQAVPKMVDELQWFQAAEKGNLALIQQGTNDKIDVNCKDSEGRSAVYLAAWKGHLQLVEYLVTQHADLSIADYLGWSPLHRAAENGHSTVVTVLLSNGADVNQADNNAKSPLHRAAYNGHEAVVTILLSYGADVNQASSNGGSSPLWWAALKGREAVVAVLLTNGADVNQADNNGKKPIDVARTQQIKDMLIAHTKKKQDEQQQQQPPPPELSSVPGQVVNVTDDLHSIPGLVVSSDEGQGQGQLEVTVDGEMMMVVMLLLDEFIAACVEEDVPIALMQLAMEKGEMPWGRSTVMFVGAGRAGKTGTERSMLGYAFEHTESTVGINNEYMFEVTSELADVDGDANFAGGSRWLLAVKAEKEYESAVAKLAIAIQQGKVDKDLEQEVVEQKAKLDTLKKDLVPTNAVAAPSAAVASLSSVPSSSAAQPALLSPVAVVPTAAGVAAGSSTVISDNEHALSPLSSTVPQEVDLEYALRMLAKDLQMNSKLLLTFLDFGGQKAFESINQFFMVEQAVYVVVFNMECFLTQDRISVDPKKGITIWSECLKVALHWLNTVVVHTMKPGSTKPAPIFIVGTHKDTVPLPVDHQAISKALSAALGGNNPALNSLQHNDAEGLCFFPIDNTLGRSDPTMTTLMKRIEAVIETQPYVKKMLPLLWFRVLDWMNGQSRFYLMYDEVAKFAKDNGFDMSTTQAVDDMLSMFHECSVLMWHNVDGLRHIVILSPIQFFVSHATNLLRQHTGTATDATIHKLPKSIEDKIQSDTLLRSDFAQMISTGIITRRLLDVLLSESEEPQVVMQLMVTYALLVPLVREEGGDIGGDGILFKYLVPALLPERTNDMVVQADGHRFVVFFSVTDAITDDCLHHGDMRDKGFLPGGLFPRLLARLVVWSEETTTARTWSCDKDSITLFFGAQQFHVTHRPDINAIQVRMFDRHTPLAIHARLKNVLEVLKAECFQSLNMSTLVEYSGDAPIQSTVRPSSSIRWLVPLSAIRKCAVFLGGGSQGVRRLAVTEVESWFDAWFVRTGASDVLLFDLFFSHRWDWHDKLFVRKLVDLLAQYTTGDNPPRSIVSFLDVDSLEDGLNLQEAFVGCLVRSRVMVVVVSWAAIARMMTHDSNGKKTTIFTIEDNVLIEWLCSLRLWHLKRIHVMPVFFGKRTDANSVGGSFFEVDAATGTSMLERLPDVEAKPSLAKAVQLMTKAGVWTSGSPVEPSAFGLTSLSVRAIVTAMTGQLGIPACDSKNPAELLRLCAAKITGILEKSGGGGGGGIPGNTSGVAGFSTTAAMPLVLVPTLPAAPVAVVSGGLDRAWAVLHTDAFVKPGLMPELHQFLAEEEFDSADDLATLLSDRYTHLLEKMTTFLTKKGEREFTVAMDRT